MTMTAPRTDPSAEAELLFAEARLRSRRRRRRRATFAGTVLGLAALAYALLSAADPTPVRPAPGGPLVDRSAFAGHGRLAFVSRGRLYLLDGSRLTALTPPGASASSPQFSPDGRLLTYAIGSSLYLARADGTGARRVGAAPTGQTWLPDGELAAAGATWRVRASGALIRTGSLPAGLIAWGPGRYVFVSSTVDQLGGGRWRALWRYEVAGSLRGARTTWDRATVTSAPATGVNGNVPGGAIVLPHGEGILIRPFPDSSSSLAADGLPVYLLRGPGATPVRLATTVGFSVTPGANGTLALTDGFNRYATLTKHVEICTAAAARCTAVATRHGWISFDPAFSPDGRTLAYVQAPPDAQSDFVQRHVVAWYATHTLWTLAPGGAAHELAGANGASAPLWSADGRTLLFTAGDALWLVPAAGGARPVRVAGPLFAPGSWPASWFQVDWPDQFAWSSGRA
jgi:dipeptidyl aminopeptidase/acylaminoacyl peptidase